MENMYTRTDMLLGSIAMDAIKSSSVLICGVGGVGGYALESLVRVGIGHIGILDNDCFSISNLNRQILATTETVGLKKVDVAETRARSINPKIIIDKYDMFLDKDNIDTIDFSKYDFIIDCIDTVTAKILLISKANELGINIICSMGTGNKLDCNFKVTDIYKTKVCPLAKAIRKKCRELGIKKLSVLYSEDEPLIPQEVQEENGRHIPGSISYAPAIAGLKLSEYVIKEIINSTWTKY